MVFYIFYIIGIILAYATLNSAMYESYKEGTFPYQSNIVSSASPVRNLALISLCLLSWIMVIVHWYDIKDSSYPLFKFSNWAMLSVFLICSITASSQSQEYFQVRFIKMNDQVEEEMRKCNLFIVEHYRDNIFIIKRERPWTLPCETSEQTLTFLDMDVIATRSKVDHYSTVLTIRFYRDLNESECKEVLDRHKIRPQSKVVGKNVYIVRTMRQSIMEKLLQEPKVMSVSIPYRYRN